MIHRPALPKAAGRQPLLFGGVICLVAIYSCGGSATSQAPAADSPVGLEVSDSSVNVVNRTGTSLVKGQVDIEAAGSLRPFTSLVPRMGNGEKRTMRLEDFRTPDGTPFRRGVHRARKAKISVTDLNGKTYQYEVPFK